MGSWRAPGEPSDGDRLIGGSEVSGLGKGSGNSVGISDVNGSGGEFCPSASIVTRLFSTSLDVRNLLCTETQFGQGFTGQKSHWLLVL